MVSSLERELQLQNELNEQIITETEKAKEDVAVLPRKEEEKLLREYDKRHKLEQQLLVWEGRVNQASILFLDASSNGPQSVLKTLCFPESSGKHGHVCQLQR